MSAEHSRGVEFAVVEFVVAGLAAGVARGLCRIALTSGAQRHLARWQRDNHAGSTVTLFEGPALLAGSTTGLLVRALIRPDERRQTIAVVVALIGSGLVGGYDDLYGSRQAKGFRGHLAALRRGEVTSGLIKIIGVGASSMVGSLINTRERRSSGVDLVIDTALSAGTANLINLCDLRPGRAIKAGSLVALSLCCRPGGWRPGGRHGRGPGFGAAGPILGAAAGALPSDLAGRSMLGDCGANAVGAGLGTAMTGSPRGFRLVALGAVLGLNLISERYSFTTLIEANPLLRRIDQLGRRR